jgi:basic amino acid/polyamine antiporter, APA family
MQPFVRENRPKHAAGQELVRAIGRWSLAALTVNFMVGSGVFGMPSILAGLLGRASVLVVLIAAAAIATVMACFAELASRFTETGGPYLYVRVAFGRFWGIQVGWLSWLVRLTACAANANLLVAYLAEFWADATRPFARFLIVTLVVGTIATVNYRGVRLGAQVSNAFTLFKLLPIGVLCAAGIFYVTAHRLIPVTIVSADTNAWMHALLLLTVPYGGFEAALTPVGEAKNPRRDAPFALLVALVTCTTIYVLIQWVVVRVLPDPAHSSRPLADVARIIMGPGGAALIAMGAIVAVGGILAANSLATPRITFALAERGDFPSAFAAVHPRFRTPYFSILVYALLAWLLALFGSFVGNATLSAMARLLVFGLVCAALPVLRKKQPAGAAFQMPAGLLFAGLGLVYCFGLLARSVTGKSLVLVTTMAIALLNWLAIRNRKTSAAQAS